MNANQEDNDNTVITNKFPNDEYLLAIGKFVVTFSRLEEIVVDITGLLFGCEPEVIANITYPLDMRNRLLALRGILAYRFGSRDKSDQGVNLKRDKDIKKINRLFKKLQNATEKRNLLVHSSWHGDPETNLTHRLSPRGRQATGYPGGSMSLVSVSEIEKDTIFVEQVTNELWKFFWDNFGGWISQRAKNGGTGIYMIGE